MRGSFFYLERALKNRGQKNPPQRKVERGE